MKLMFVHDIKAQVYNNEVFARSYGYDIWKDRYLTSFDNIKVLFRTTEICKDLNGICDKSSGPNVYFDRRIGMFLGPDVFFSERIKSIIKENIDTSDAVIVRLDSFLGLQTIRECRKKGKPYMIELVGCAWDSFWNHGIAGKILAPYLFWRTRLEVKRAPFVVYVTNEFLQKRYPTQGVSASISNVKLKAQDKAVLAQRLRKIKNNKGVLVLGTAANVDVRYKGQQYVIEAIGKLKKAGITNFEYQLLGAGNQDYLRNVSLQNDVIENIKFLGSCPHEKVFEWLKNTVDIYIQPSLQEGLPRSLIEAMSVGLPCIGSDVAGIPELIDSKMIFSRNGNKAELIKQILHSLTKDDMLIQSNRNYREAKKYDYSLLLEKRKSILELFKKQIRE